MAKGHRKTPEEKAAVAKQKRKQRRAKRKKEARDNLTKEEILQDSEWNYLRRCTVWCHLGGKGFETLGRLGRK